MLKYIAASSLLIMSMSSQASYVFTDVFSENDKKATLDTTTGIEWLKYNETYDKSFNTISELTAKGETYEGWRLPTKQEVSTLLYNYFSYSYDFIGNEGNVGTDDYFSVSSSADHNLARSFMNQFGFVSTITPSNYSYVKINVLYKNDDGNIEDFYAYQSNYTSTASKRRVRNVTLRTTLTDYTDDYRSSSAGIFLVSDGGVTLSSIQEPSLNAMNPNSPYNVPAWGVGLLSLGLLFSIKKRK